MIAELVLISTMSWQVTSYRSVPEQTDSTPFNTSTGARTNSAICAVSQDELGNKIHYGDYLFIEIPAKPELSRYCWCQDTMNKRIKHAVDFWVETKAQEHSVGVRRGFVYKLPAPGELMQINPTVRRHVPADVLPQALKTFKDIRLKNPNADENYIWNLAAQLVWLTELADTQIFIKRLLNSFK